MRRLICTFVVRIWHKTHFRTTWPNCWIDRPVQNSVDPYDYSLIRVYSICHSVCIFGHIMVEPPCSNCRVITANFSGVQIFMSFMEYADIGNWTGVKFMASNGFTHSRSIKSYHYDSKFLDRHVFATCNNVNTGPEEAVSSGSSLFAILSAVFGYITHCSIF